MLELHFACIQLLDRMNEQGMDLLRLWRAPPLSGFSLTMGVGEKTSLFLFQMMCFD